jgi:hypothetical protein
MRCFDQQSRGLRSDRSLLIVRDGSKALHKAVTQTSGSAALIQPLVTCTSCETSWSICRRGQRPWVRAIIARTYKQAEVATVRRLPQNLARSLEVQAGCPLAGVSG